VSFDPIYSVLQKRIRNKRKKLDKIKQAEEVKSTGKDLTPEQLDMIQGKELIQAQIKEYEDILKGIRAEVKTIKAEIADANSASTQKETTSSVELIADALLVNSLHNNLEKSILDETQHAALNQALSAITSISNPGKVIDYPRMKQGFTQLFNDLISASEEKVPGTTVSFGDIHSGLTSIDDSVTGKVHEWEE